VTAPLTPLLSSGRGMGVLKKRKSKIKTKIKKRIKSKIKMKSKTVELSLSPSDSYS
jgi:hypothetical protein